MIIVSGMHRSGTTLLGELLCKLLNKKMIYEPFNKELGVKNVNQWYFHTPDIKNRYKYQETIDDFINLKSEFKTTKIDNDSFIKAVGRKIFKSRGNIDYQIYKLQKLFIKNQQMLIKDPFILLSLGYILKKYKNTKAVVCVRHPVSIYRSMLRMNWRFDFNEILCQEEFVNEYLNDFKDEMSNIKELYEEVGYLWKILYGYLLNIKKRIDNTQLYFLNWEEFSVNPENELAKLFEFLGEKCIKNENNFIEKYMFSERDLNNKNQHNLYRNSKKLALSFKENLKKEELKLMEICNDEFKSFYDKNLCGKLML